MTSPRSVLVQALSLHQQGKFLETEAMLRELLAREPRNGDALHMLGVALAARGGAREAAQLIAAAVDLQPSNPVAHSNLGNALGELGRYAEAVTCYDRAVALQPDFASAYRARALAQFNLGQSDAALASFNQAVACAPDDAQYRNDLGVALDLAQRHEEALQCFSHAIALDPRLPEAHYNRGKICLQFGHPAEAIASFDRSLALAPQKFETHLRRGISLAMLGRNEEAIASFDQAILLNPSSAEAFDNRGVALGRMSRPSEALASFFKATEVNPDYADAYSNAANALKSLHKHTEALQYFDRALSCKPGDPVSTWGKALIKLSLGEFREGWALYESRFRVAHLTPLQRSFEAPRWSGTESLEGKTLLVHAEQGLGDTLQFCRYIRLIEAKGARVVFEVQPVLAVLLRSLDIRGPLVAKGDPLPAFDFHCPLLSLPFALRTEQSIPADVPYVSAGAVAVRKWQRRLALLPGLRVGINWQGNLEAEKQNSLQGRSFALADAAPLARIPDVQLISLQKGSAAKQRTSVEFGEAVMELSDPLDMGAEEFADSAGLLMSLDLVVTSDTAVAHLAGALGVPVWVALHSVPDWRWMIDRDDSPWYPTMRLFRQPKSGGWAAVFHHMAAELPSFRAIRGSRPNGEE